MGYSIDPISANCYEGTTCLINKFGVQNEEQLANLEATITHAKTTLLESQPAKLPLDFDYYKSIHRFLFEDLYDWAGELRTVDLSKKGTAFCPADQLESLCNACFDRLQKMNYLKGLAKPQFIEELVDLYCSTNLLHPFREGNGRAQRIFISKLIEYNGYQFNFSNIDPDDLMTATIQAANGVTDQLHALFQNELK